MIIRIYIKKKKLIKKIYYKHVNYIYIKKIKSNLIIYDCYLASTYNNIMYKYISAYNIISAIGLIYTW